MNTSEVKKIIWSINLIIGFMLSILIYFIYQQLSTPMPTVKPFEYTEPNVNSSPNSFARGVTRGEVEKEFGWKEPVEIKEKINGKNHGNVKEIVPVTQNINDVFTLNVILGKLAFVYIIKDDQLKSLIKNDEIIDKNGEVLGVLKEIQEDSVLILFKGNIEELKMVNDHIVDVYNMPSAGDIMKTTLGSSANRTIPKRIDPNSNPPKIEADKTPSIKQKDDLVFEVNQTTDDDGVIHRQLSSELKEKLGTKELSQKLSSASSYSLEFKPNGILIKNIKDPEVKKILNAFGIQDADIIVSVNGQALGNKTEDDLVILYQEIKRSANFATIELLRNGATQKFRVSIKN